MTLFTNHLYNEGQLILNGLEVLNAYQLDLVDGKEVSLSNLRIVAFAIQRLFEHSHIAKLETILYPALVNSPQWKFENPNLRDKIKAVFESHAGVRQNFLALRIAIDDFDQNPAMKGVLSWRLCEFVEQSMKYIELEKEVLNLASKGLLESTDQKKLFILSQNFEAAFGVSQLQGLIKIINNLRLEKGLIGA